MPNKKSNVCNPNDVFFFSRRDDIRIADVKDEDDEYGRGEDEYGRGGGEDEDEDRADQRLEEAAAAVSDPRLRRLAASRGTSRGGGRGRHAGSEDDEDDQEEDGENDVRHRRRHNRSE